MIRPMTVNMTIIETTLNGIYLKFSGIRQWAGVSIGDSVYDHGTREANEVVRIAYQKLRSGMSPVICGFFTKDGHSCSAIMKLLKDKVVIYSTDTTPPSTKKRLYKGYDKSKINA